MDHFSSSASKELGATEISQTASGGVSPKKRSKKWIWFVALAALGYLTWYGVTVRAKAQPQAQGAGGASSGRGGRGSQTVSVEVATAQRGDLPIYLNGLGNATAFNTVTMRSRVDGQLINVAFKEGQFVREGDLLAEIDPRPFQVQLEQAQGQLARDQSLLRDAQVNFERFTILFQEGVIAKQQLDSQGAQVGQYEGAIKSDQAQIDNAKLQLTYSRITAPISGRVGLRLVDPGNIVRANDPNGMLVITQLQPIAVLFSLPQDQLPEVNKKLRAGIELPVEAYDRDNTTKIATGKLLTIDNQIDSATGTYKLKAIFNNDDDALFPNQFVNVHLLLDVRRDLIIIPAAAIQRGPQGAYVYVVQNGNTAKLRNVSVAQLSGNNVGVSSGLAAGEVVVTDGQDKLQDGSRIEARAAGESANQPAAPGGAGAEGGHRRGGEGKKQ